MAKLIEGGLRPEVFIEIYANALNNPHEKGLYDAYMSDKEWTKRITKIAKDSIKNIYLDADEPPKWKVTSEYFRIDLIGYLSFWYQNNPSKQQDWLLQVAYEHENSKHWDDELCKLCHIVADLKILAAYHDFQKEAPIEEILQAKINKLGAQRMCRVPNCNWLFIFGPIKHYGDKFRAFTINSDLKIVELQFKNAVIPNKWK